MKSNYFILEKIEFYLHLFCYNCRRKISNCARKCLETNGIHLISHILSMLRKIYLHRVNIDEERFTVKIILHTSEYIMRYTTTALYTLLNFLVFRMCLENYVLDTRLVVCGFANFLLHLTFNLVKEKDAFKKDASNVLMRLT